MIIKRNSTDPQANINKLDKDKYPLRWGGQLSPSTSPQIYHLSDTPKTLHKPAANRLNT